MQLEPKGSVGAYLETHKGTVLDVGQGLTEAVIEQLDHKFRTLGESKFQLPQSVYFPGQGRTE